MTRTAKKKTIRTIPQERTEIPVQDPKARIGNFAEVALGFRYGVRFSLTRS